MPLVFRLFIWAHGGKLRLNKYLKIPRNFINMNFLTNYRKNAIEEIKLINYRVYKRKLPNNIYLDT